MEFTAYQLTSSNLNNLNTGSYLNHTEYSLFVNGYATDLWYGFSSNDVIELGVWDRNHNLINWKTIKQPINYTSITSSYINNLNSISTYSYSELVSDFLLYKNEKLLVNPSDEISASFNIISGSYFLTYNFIREMAGSSNSPLVIKEISPSRKELKLVPIDASNNAYTAFCEEMVLVSDISSLYIQSLKNCPYEKLYNQLHLSYQSEINTIKSLFFLNTDGEVITFLQKMYEDSYIYVSTVSDGIINSNTVRTQGIFTYFSNYLLSSSDNIVNFSDLDDNFHGYVSASIENKFSVIGKSQSLQYISAKLFIYNFFYKYFYTPITSTLSTTYLEKYFAPLKNALNFGNNRLLPIINTGMMDERNDASGSLTLLIKLQSELPNDIMAQTQCWISNISLTPYIVNAIIISPTNTPVYQIGPPNFSVPIKNASLTKTNLSYTAADLQNTNEIEREIVVSKNIEELAIDYTNFNNFVVFSSAELRLKIFKNKIINISTLSSSLQALNNNNITYLSSSGYQYPLYNQEYSTIQTQINGIINSFDGYESYLYRSGNYTFLNSNFISSSYVIEMDNSASYYDIQNRDSLINNCSEHVIVNVDNNDYLTFLCMVGHFFDNIYIYISNLSSEKKLGYKTTEEFTRRVVDYMLETFGWTLDDSLEQSTIINNYLTSDQISELNKLSSEERLKTIRNRILINLPQIYKTKGTDESVKLILACYGIPSTLLSIREYGGINYTNKNASYTTYERVYMRQWNASYVNDNYSLQYPTSSNTILFKFAIDKFQQYTYENEQILIGKVDPSVVSLTDISGSGDWAIGFVRIPKQNSGKLFFRIGYKGYETFKIYSPEFPLFDGNIYSVMLRQNIPDENFEYTSNIHSVPTKYDLYVQRNEFGNQILRLTSSNICYNTASILKFNSSGTINIIGNFSYYNEVGYNGIFDKFQLWNIPIEDDNYEDYVNSINSYSYSGSAYSALLFRMHTDYPFNNTSLSKWQNANSYYAHNSINKLGINVDYLTSTNAWNGETKLVYNSASCQYVSQSCYPYQFKVLDYSNTWPISKYGPNKFRNEKVNYVSQSIEARFDSNARSTYVANNQISPDSNQIGFFVDPQDFKNKDIIRYF